MLDGINSLEKRGSKKRQVEERFVDPVELSEPREGSVQDLGIGAFSLVSHHLTQKPSMSFLYCCC